MNSNELQSELSLNKSDKQLAKAELEASKKKWVEYILQHKNEIYSNLQPIRVRKKKSTRLKEFINKIKTIFGLVTRKENINGIEAYLQYSDNIE